MLWDKIRRMQGIAATWKMPRCAWRAAHCPSPPAFQSRYPLLTFIFKSLICSGAYSVFQTQWKSVMTSTGTTHLTTYRRAVVDCASICRFIDSICCQRSFLLLPGSGNSVRALVQCKDGGFQIIWRLATREVCSHSDDLKIWQRLSGREKVLISD